MTVDVEEFIGDLRNQVVIQAEVSNDFIERSFVELVSDHLADAGMLDNFESGHYYHKALGIRIDGYAWSELDRTLVVCVSHYTNEVLPTPLSQSEVVKNISRLQKFCLKSLDDSFVGRLEESSEGFSASEYIREHTEKAHRIRYLFLTDCPLSNRIKELSVDPFNGIPAFVEVWDLNRIKDLFQYGGDTEPFEIDFGELCGGISALPAHTGSSEAQNFLVVMPGEVLNQIYDRFGQRLLEANVRTFLDFRSGVNRGMRETLLRSPEKFFAYNNGLTVTATGIDFEFVEGGVLINKLDNMQIVNGGQTTAAIYFAPKERDFKEIDLSQIFVQMKLTVLDDEDLDSESDSLKSQIARYANTQNKVDAADLVSNHPFHRRLENLSRKVLAPASAGQIQAKWFYERARGQYGTVLRGKLPSEQKKFKQSCPPSHKFTKTDFAKYENTWRMNPHLVSKGAQANLKLLGLDICKEFENDEDSFREPFFQDLIAKLILFKSTEKIISSSEWYKESPGFRANIVTYVIAWLRYLAKESGKDINLQTIWRRQAVSVYLESEISRLGYHVRELIVDPLWRVNPDGRQVNNPSEWCKQASCWDKLKKTPMELQPIIASDLIGSDELLQKEKGDKEIGTVSGQVEAMEVVLGYGAEVLTKLAAWYRHRGYPEGGKEIKIASQAAGMFATGKMITDKQAAILIQNYEAACSEGFQP